MSKKPKKTQTWDESETPIETQAEILSELWMNERDSGDFQDIFAYGDLAFPLAYAITNGIVEPTDRANEFVHEVFDLLISSFGLEDTGFEDLDDILMETGSIHEDE